MLKNYSTQMVAMLDDLIPVVMNDVNSSQKDVKDLTLKCLKKLLKCCNNQDLEPFIPVIMETITNPSSICSSVEKLASCVFVQNVEAPALAVVTPILLKGLREERQKQNVNRVLLLIICVSW